LGWLWLTDRLDAYSRGSTLATMMLSIAAKYAERQGLSTKLLSKFVDAPGPSLIIPRLYVGDYKDAGNLNLLSELRVTHVVSVVEKMPWPLFKTKLKKLHVSINDYSSTNIIEHLDHTTNYIRKALNNPESVVMVRIRLYHLESFSDLIDPGSLL
jgi:hypothetical protein